MNAKRKASPSKSAARFRKDFAPLERSLTLQKKLGALVGTPEMMIVELNLTPEVVRVIETENAVRFNWFAPTYAALARHGLLPGRKMAWDDWLKQYHAKKAELRAEEQWERNRAKERKRGTDL